MEVQTAWKSSLVVTLLILWIKSSNSIECYVCSFSPLSNSSRLDVCTDGAFQPSMIDAWPCSIGCEAVSVLNSDDELESFHRNCAHRSSPLNQGCITTNNILIKRKVCACDWNFCNSSSKKLPSATLGMFMFLLCSLMWISMSNPVLIQRYLEFGS